MGVKPPQPPRYDSEVQVILSTFFLVSRSRRYSGGQPLKVSVRDITDVVAVHPVGIPRDVLDAVIFELDDYALNKSAKNAEDKIAQ